MKGRRLGFRLILKDIEPDDWPIAILAGRHLKDRFQQDAWLVYGKPPNAREFYAKRNKGRSITVRRCYAHVSGSGNGGNDAP